MFEGKEFTKIDQEIDKHKDRIKGLEDLKVSGEVFDRFTLLSLYDIVNKGYFEVLHGAVKTGKESHVFLAKDRFDSSIAVKIHRMVSSDFKAMLKYIEGDRRFERIRKSRRSIILTWVEKEFRNLKTAYDAGVSVPAPIVFKNNIIVMEFIGSGLIPAPMLKTLGTATPTIYRGVVDNVKRLYEADIVHGDLSEYNILIKEGKPYLIDLSQSVPRDHPLAEELVKRDVHNLARYFNKKFDKVYADIIS